MSIIEKERFLKMIWTEEKIRKLVSRQRSFFQSDSTLDVEWRIRQLKRLRNAIKAHEKDIERALEQDLGRSKTEAYFCDIGSTILEINEIIRGIRKWARPELHYSGVHCFPSLLTKVYKMPYGVTLIISPFNFPILLSFGVLAASIAGGNTAIIKASSKSKACTEVMQKIISSVFPDGYICVVDGDHDTADLLLEQRFDKIFYTGSPKVGRHVMEMAAKNLTPVALELGGETGNWCVIRKDADIRDAARKIAFFKILNAGQICININQVAVAEEVADSFVEELKKQFRRQIGEEPLKNKEYPRLISQKAYTVCAEEAARYQDRIVYGGHGDEKTMKFEPTIVYPVGADEAIVQHELFDPLLPVVPFPDQEADNLMQKIAEREHGLALYLFTKDRTWAEKVMSSQQYGGGCVNEVVMHLMVKGVPFNGAGHSGMGAYHGIWGFREFTHPSTVLYGSNKYNLPLREHPYEGAKNRWKMLVLKAFER